MAKFTLLTVRLGYYLLTATVMATQGPFIKSPASVKVRGERLLV